MSHILNLDNDGYLGWPTAMCFSNRDYEVAVVDNYFRRNTCAELGAGLLYPDPTLVGRAKIWFEKTGKKIKVAIAGLAQPDVMRRLFGGRIQYVWAIRYAFTGIPDTVVHYAEPGEKLYDELMNDEARRSVDLSRYFSVLQAFLGVCKDIVYDYPDLVSGCVTNPCVSPREASLSLDEIIKFLNSDHLLNGLEDQVKRRK